MALTRRQRQVLDFITRFIDQKGYSPSLEEVARHLGLSSVATVHKHVTRLVEKGLVRRGWNQNRSIEPVPPGGDGRAVDLPLVGRVAAGRPIEAVEDDETISVPESMVTRRGGLFALEVSGDSMIDEQIRDGDTVVVEGRKTADDGDVVVAVIDGSEATLKKLYRENGRVRLQPANPKVRPIIVEGDRVEIRGVVVGLIRRYR